MGPFPGSDGGNGPRLVNEFVPGLTACLNDVVVGCEDQVRQPIVPDELPDVLDGIEFWRSGWQRHQGDVFRYIEFRGQMPTRLIKDNHGVGAWGNGSADHGEMLLHRVGIAVGHDEAGALALCRTDGAEDVGPLGALIVRCPRARATLGPSAGELVRLTYSGFVLPPQLNLEVFCELRADLSQPGGGAFF